MYAYEEDLDATFFVGIYPCPCCRRPNLASVLKYGSVLKRRRHRTCNRCANKRATMVRQRRTGNACSAVSTAIKSGVLSALWHQYCVDCGAQATEYDHRDYSRPLDVDPVCHRCNSLRGPGIYLNAA